MLGGGGTEGGYPPDTAAVSKHETKYVTQHEGARSRGGSGGGFPVQARDKICDPASGGVLDGRGGGGFPPPARLLCPSTRQIL